MGVFICWMIASVPEREGTAGVSSTCLFVAAPIGLGGGPCRSQAAIASSSTNATIKLIRLTFSDTFTQPILQSLMGVVKGRECFITTLGSSSWPQRRFHPKSLCQSGRPVGTMTRECLQLPMQCQLPNLVRSWVMMRCHELRCSGLYGKREPQK